MCIYFTYKCLRLQLFHGTESNFKAKLLVLEDQQKTRVRSSTSLLFKWSCFASVKTRPFGRVSYSLFHNVINLYPVHTICKTKCDDRIPKV